MIHENTRSDAPCIDDMLSYVRKALDKITNHISSVESQLKTERRRWKKPSLYKTELCEHWRNKRKCLFGMKCWYAHGPHELRPNSGSTSANSCTTSGISSDETSNPETAVSNSNDQQQPAVSDAQPSMCHGPPLAFGPPQHQQPPPGMRPAFFVSFDGRVPFAAAPAPPIMAGGLHAGPPPPVPVSAATSTVMTPTSSGGNLPSLKPNDSTYQQLLGLDFFRSNNMNANFGPSAGLNFGMSGFGFAAPPPTAFAASDNWMGALASSFIIPSKNIWLHQQPTQQ